MYAEYHKEHGRYRTGGRKLAPEVKLAHTTSWEEHWSDANEARRANKGEIKRAAQSDSPHQVMGDRITGNCPMPATRQLYRAIMRRAIQVYQTLKRGGLAARNWHRVEIKSEDWGQEGHATGYRKEEAVGDSPPRNSHGLHTRRCTRREGNHPARSTRRRQGGGGTSRMRSRIECRLRKKCIMRRRHTPNRRIR